MATVEELVKALQKRFEVVKIDTMTLRHLVDSLIAAAEAQGVEKGAWAEIEFLRQNTRNDINIGRYLPYDNFLHPQELAASILSPAPKEEK